MVKYLVTGGCGFIGSHLVESLLERGCAVTVLDDLSTGRKEHLFQNASHIHGSITDRNLLKEALADVDGVFHMAAVPSVQKSIEHWSETTHVNYMGVVNLLETIAQSGRKTPFIYASSAAVYGEIKALPLNEREAPRPLSPYGADKAGNELCAKTAWDVFQIPSLGFRFFNVYGPRQDPSSMYSGVISVFADKIPKGETVTIYGDGEQTRDFIYVKDVARMLCEAMEHPLSEAGVYNFCTGNCISVNDLAELIAKISKLELKKEHAPARPGEAYKSVGDPYKTKHQLNLDTKYSLEDGLRELLQEKVGKEG